MVRVFDVDANALLAKTAEKLKAMGINKPEFAGVVKSGAHAERPPESEDFWYVRCASLMRQAYVNSEVGVQRMRRHYGGKKNRGVRPEKHVPAGGSVIRKAFQELEKAGLMEKGKEGRKLTAKGKSLLDKSASEL
ncbi:30S ribosomal protein S19e [Candidatus Micrarchaeota archaeon]|nr:30S ribosomal protein S19e [Candidatus Micrarchaeota archaeon]